MSVISYTWLFIVHLLCNSLSAGLYRKSCSSHTHTKPARLLNMWFAGDCSAIFNEGISNSFHFINQNSSICILSSYQFCHIFVSSFWALHQLHLLPASPSSPSSCHCRKRCWFPYCDSISRNRTQMVNSKLFGQQPRPPQQLPAVQLLNFLCATELPMQTTHCRDHSIYQRWQLASVCHAGGGLGARACAGGIDPCIWNP